MIGDLSGIRAMFVTLLSLKALGSPWEPTESLIVFSSFSTVWMQRGIKVALFSRVAATIEAQIANGGRDKCATHHPLSP